MAERTLPPKPTPDVDSEKEPTINEIIAAAVEAGQSGRAKLRSANKMQQQPKATGNRYADFEIYLCKPNVSKIPIPNSNQVRTIVSGITVTDRVRQVKVEPYLVYGKKEEPYSKGFNDQFLLGSDGSGLIQVYFPLKLDEKGEKDIKFGASEGDKFNATTLEIWVNCRSHGRDMIQKREFNLFEYRGSKSLKEQVADIKAIWEHKFADNSLIS